MSFKPSWAPLLMGVWHHHRHNIILTIFRSGKVTSHAWQTRHIGFHPFSPFSLFPRPLHASVSVTLSFPFLPSLPHVFLPFPPSLLVTCIHRPHSCQLYIESLDGQTPHLSAQTLAIQCRATAVLQQAGHLIGMHNIWTKSAGKTMFWL